LKTTKQNKTNIFGFFIPAKEDQANSNYFEVQRLVQSIQKQLEPSHKLAEEQVLEQKLAQELGKKEPDKKELPGLDKKEQLELDKKEPLGLGKKELPALDKKELPGLDGKEPQVVGKREPQAERTRPYEPSLVEHRKPVVDDRLVQDGL
jgi:hypothetical protein